MSIYQREKRDYRNKEINEKIKICNNKKKRKKKKSTISWLTWSLIDFLLVMNYITNDEKMEIDV